ncbi:MAG: hypothetical protein GX443_00995 [Deltaproteobacteria bacterium]|nr:hypothetical protein [Deltaproteobacteria bacterium]
MSRRVTPLSLYQEYRRLRVAYEDPVTYESKAATVDVHHYFMMRWPKDYPSATEWKQSKYGQAQLQREKIVQGVRGYFGRDARVFLGKAADVGSLSYDLFQPFQGKGSPGQIAAALAWAARSGAIKGTGVGGSLKEKDLQAFCDSYVGIDCLGFVNNYFLASGRLQGRHRDIPVYYAKGRKLARESASDVIQSDILIWMVKKDKAFSMKNNPGHIALVEKVQGTGSWEVVESHGGKGLDHNVYSVLQEPEKTGTSGIFHVDRGIAGKGCNYVAVVPFVP